MRRSLRATVCAALVACVVGVCDAAPAPLETAALTPDAAGAPRSPDATPAESASSPPATDAPRTAAPTPRKTAPPRTPKPARKTAPPRTPVPRRPTPRPTAPPPRAIAPRRIVPTPSPTLSPTSRPERTASPRPLPSGRREASSRDMVGLLDAYRTAIATYRTPQTQTYLYTIDQVGDRGLSQTHLMYRDGPMVRDETVALGALSIKPHIHIYKSRARHYTIEGTAPRLSAYRFLYAGSRVDGPRTYHTFTTLPIGAPGRFTVTSVEIDEKRALPVRITFRARGAGVAGEGVLRFGPIENAWVILSAEATGRAGKSVLRERLNFTDYRFPGSLPGSTFGAFGSS